MAQAEKILGRKAMLKMTAEEMNIRLQAYLPEEGVLWPYVLSSKQGIINDQIEKIEEASNYETPLKVKALIGWSAYPRRH